MITRSVIFILFCISCLSINARAEKNNLINALKLNMEYNQHKLVVLSNNVANVNTPQYKSKTLAEIDYFDPTYQNPTNSQITLARTNPKHFKVKRLATKFKTKPNNNGAELKANGNNVDIEKETIAINGNDQEYNLALKLYSKLTNLTKAVVAK